MDEAQFQALMNMLAKATDMTRLATALNDVRRYANSEIMHVNLLLSGLPQVLVQAKNSRDRVILINPSTANSVTVRFDGKLFVASEGMILTATTGSMPGWDSGTDSVPLGAIEVLGTAGQFMHAIVFTKSATLWPGQ